VLNNGTSNLVLATLEKKKKSLFVGSLLESATPNNQLNFVFTHFKGGVFYLFVVSSVEKPSEVIAE